MGDRPAEKRESDVVVVTSIFDHLRARKQGIVRCTMYEGTAQQQPVMAWTLGPRRGVTNRTRIGIKALLALSQPRSGLGTTKEAGGSREFTNRRSEDEGGLWERRMREWKHRMCFCFLMRHAVFSWSTRPRTEQRTFSSERTMADRGGLGASGWRRRRRRERELPRSSKAACTSTSPQSVSLHDPSTAWFCTPGCFQPCACLRTSGDGENEAVARTYRAS